MRSVTAIIPAYNAERFVADAIRSVLDQTLPIAECVVVDDGSSDGTAAIVESFGDPVRLIRQLNAGVSAARNAAAREAEGELLAFLDADDAWLPHKLERQVPLATDGVGLVYGAYMIADEELRPGEAVAPASPAEALRNMLLMVRPSINVSQTGVVPLDVYRAIGGFDERLSTSADFDLAVRIALHWQLRTVDEPIALYRSHGAQMHADLQAMEHDMTLALRGVFDRADLPPEIRRLRRQATARLYAVLAASHAEAGDRPAAARATVRSLVADPRGLLTAVTRRVKRS